MTFSCLGKFLVSEDKVGIFLMLGESLAVGQMIGNIAAFIMPISFAVLILVVRKYPNVDMVPAQFVAGVSSCLIGFLSVSYTHLTLPTNREV